MKEKPFNLDSKHTSESIGSEFESSNDSHLTSPNKKAISRVSKLLLEQGFWHWKAKSMIYEVTFQESWLISMVTRSKEPLFASRLKGEVPI